MLSTVVILVCLSLAVYANHNQNLDQVLRQLEEQLREESDRHVVSNKLQENARHLPPGEKSEITRHSPVRKVSNQLRGFEKTFDLNELDMLMKIKMYREFQCPSLDLILLDYFSGFPNVSDISNDFVAKPDQFKDEIKDAVEAYRLLKHSRLALLHLNDNIAKSIVSGRMTCPVTKYQHLVMYVIRKKFGKDMMDAQSALYTRLINVLKKHNKYHPQFHASVIQAIYSETAEHFNEKLRALDLFELNGLLETLYMNGTEFYLRTGSFPDGNLLMKMLENASVMYQQVFRCTTLNEMRMLHKYLIRYLQNSNGPNHHPNFITFTIIPLIEEKYKEHFDDWSMHPDLRKELQEVIKDYVMEAHANMREYSEQLDSPDQIKQVFKEILDDKQMEALQMILKFLKSEGVPDVKYWKDQMKFILNELRKYKENPSTDAFQNLIDHVKQLLDKSALISNEA